MWWLVIPAVVIVAAWGYGARKVATNAPPLDAFTAAGTPKVGDIATVAIVSIEATGSPTDISVDPPAASTLTAQDKTTAEALETSGKSGGTAEFKLTAVNIPGPQKGTAAGIPVCIGEIVSAKFSQPIFFTFLAGSIQKLARDGKPVTK